MSKLSPHTQDKRVTKRTIKITLNKNVQKKEKELVQLHCTHCSFKIISDGSNLKLTPIAYAKPPARANGKSTDTHNLGMRFKCPQCGYVIRGFKLPPQEPTDLKKTDPNRKIGIDERLHKPPSEADFMKEIDMSMRGIHDLKRK